MKVFISLYPETRKNCFGMEPIRRCSILIKVIAVAVLILMVLFQYMLIAKNGDPTAMQKSGDLDV